MSGIPKDFEFDQLPEDFEHFEPILEMAVNRVPMLEKAGIHTFLMDQRASHQTMLTTLVAHLKWKMFG